MPKLETRITFVKATVADVDEYVTLEKRVKSKTYSALVLKEDVITKVGVDNIYSSGRIPRCLHRG